MTTMIMINMLNALVAKRLKALDCKSGERKLHVSSNLTECSRFRDVAQPG
jgi:hypothetical protein